MDPCAADPLVDDHDVAALHAGEQGRILGLLGQPLQMGAGAAGDLPRSGHAAAPLEQLCPQVVPAIRLLPDAAVAPQGGQQRVDGALGVAGGLTQRLKGHGDPAPVQQLQQLQRLAQRPHASLFLRHHTSSFRRGMGRKSGFPGKLPGSPRSIGGGGGTSSSRSPA